MFFLQDLRKKTDEQKKFLAFLLSLILFLAIFFLWLSFDKNKIKNEPDSTLLNIKAENELKTIFENTVAGVLNFRYFLQKESSKIEEN